MSEELWNDIAKLSTLAVEQNKKIEALENRVAELEAKVNQVHPDYCNCGTCVEMIATRVGL